MKTRKLFLFQNTYSHNGYQCIKEDKSNEIY